MKYSPSTYTDDTRRQHEHEKDRHGSDEKDTTPVSDEKILSETRKYMMGLKMGLYNAKENLVNLKIKQYKLT